jgi:hypothetical protein
MKVETFLSIGGKLIFPSGYTIERMGNSPYLKGAEDEIQFHIFAFTKEGVKEALHEGALHNEQFERSKEEGILK